MARILLVSAELADVAAAGGVAEYVLGLAAALLAMGHDVRVVMPKYRFLLEKFHPRSILTNLWVRTGAPHNTDVLQPHNTDVLQFELDVHKDGSLKLPILLTGSHPHFEGIKSARDPLYPKPPPGMPWPEHDSWIAFCRAVVELLLSSSGDWQPDVIHCQDVHTALVPVYVSQLRWNHVPGFANHCRTVLTIHNLEYQGRGYRSLVSRAGLPDELFHSLFEFHGIANTFKAGMYTADAVSTVSVTYAQEISSRACYELLPIG